MARKKTFKTVFNRYQIELQDKDGKTTEHELHQLPMGRMEKWQAFAKERTKFNPLTKRAEITNFENYHTFLLSLCLYDLGKKEYWKLEDLNSEIPAVVTAELFNQAAFLNGLSNEDPDAEEKPVDPLLAEYQNPKDQSATTKDTTLSSPPDSEKQSDG